MGSFHLRIDGCIFLFADKAGEVLRVQCDAHCIITSKRFAGHFALRGNYLGISVPFPPGKVKVKILGFHTILIVFFCFFIQNCSHRQFPRSLAAARFCTLKRMHSAFAAGQSCPTTGRMRCQNPFVSASAAARTSYSPSWVSPLRYAAPCQRSGPAAPVLPAPAADPGLRGESGGAFLGHQQRFRGRAV